MKKEIIYIVLEILTAVGIPLAMYLGFGLETILDGVLCMLAISLIIRIREGLR